jgi:hypothetical protein
MREFEEIAQEEDRFIARVEGRDLTRAPSEPRQTSAEQR